MHKKRATLREKGPSAISNQYRPRAACTFVHYDQDLLYLLKKSTDSFLIFAKCVDPDQTVNVQIHLGLHCLHIAE